MIYRQHQALPRIVAIAALLCWSASASWAKDQNDPLTLISAIELAIARNETAELAQLRLAKARAERRQAYALLLPQLSLSAAYTRRSQEVAREVGGQRGIFQSVNALNAEAKAQLSLIDAAAIPLIRAARRRVDAQREESYEMRRALAFATAEAFLTVLGNEQLALAAKQRLKHAQSLSALASARVGTGLGNRIDQTRARLEVASAQLALTRAANAVAAARLGLSHLLVEPRALKAPLREPQLHDRALPSLAAQSKQAAKRRPDLRALRLRAEAARLAAQQPWLSFVPNVALQAGFELTNETGFSGRHWDYRFGLVATWLLYDGGARYGQTDQLAAERREALLHAKALARQVTQEIAQAQLEITSARAALTQASAALALAQDNAEQVRQRFSAGLANGLILADASATLFEAQAEVARQRFGLQRAQLALMQATGLWPLGTRKQAAR